MENPADLAVGLLLSIIKMPTNICGSKVGMKTLELFYTISHMFFFFLVQDFSIFFPHPVEFSCLISGFS